MSYNNPQVARFVNQSNTPLLISNSFGINFGNILSLSYLLDPKVRFQLVDGQTQPDFMNIPTIPPGFSDVFLLNLSEEFQRKLEEEDKVQLNLVFNDYHLLLWNVIKS